MWQETTGEYIMTNNINGIGINTKGVNSYVNPKTQGEAKSEENANNKQAQTTGAQVKPEDVLTYMAQNAVVVNPKSVTRTYDVAKYVTPEQAARIAGFIGGFEDEVAKGLLAINEELKGVNLPEAAKYELAAKMAESKN